MQSSLPMYDGGPSASAALWECVASQLIADGVPTVLTQPTDLVAHWLAPDLLLSQTCGYPLTHALAGRVQVVGVFSYNALGCEGPRYRSQLVCRSADKHLPLAGFRGRVVAYNSEDSQSGYNSLRALTAPLARHGAFFSRAVATGAHRASVEAVRDGQADLAAIDAVSWALLQRDHPGVAQGVQVFGQTASAPGLPLITSVHTPPALLQALRQALHHAMEHPGAAAARATLLVQGFRETSASAYEEIVQMEQRANRAAYRL